MALVWLSPWLMVGVGVLGILIGGQGVIAAVNAPLRILARVPRSWAVLMHGEEQQAETVVAAKGPRTSSPDRGRTALVHRPFQSTQRAISKSGAQKHKKLRSGSLEFVYGAHDSTSDVSIKLRIQLPDGRWVSATDHVVPGIFYYPVRFVFPDDFEGQELLRGTYHVSWLSVTRRAVDPNRPFGDTAMMYQPPYDVYDEKVIASEEFVL